MHYTRSFFLLIFLSFTVSQFVNAQGKRVIMFGAHPDDCDIESGGTAILLAKAGYAVKFVSITNGDAGHQSIPATELARKRFAEAKEAGKRFGVTYDVLDNHDGLLMPTLDVRLQVIRKIREWNADVVFAPRPNDYHPDHRYTGVLVQDASYMVAVPKVAPDTKALDKNPVFLYFQDRFQRPNPFRPDIVIDISEVFQQKVHALDAHQSQFYDWLPWIGHSLNEVPKEAKDREPWLAKQLSGPLSADLKAAAEKWYGKQQAASITHVEAFEICEYGAQPDEAMIREIFPMLPRR